MGSASEVVNVVAEAVNIQSESATLGRVVTSSEIKNIPLNGRNPIFLALLKPGVNAGNALAQFSFGPDYRRAEYQWVSNSGQPDHL